MATEKDVDKIMDLVENNVATAETAINSLNTEILLLRALLAEQCKRVYVLEKVVRDGVRVAEQGADNFGLCIAFILDLINRDPTIMASEEWTKVPQRVQQILVMFKEIDDEERSMGIPATKEVKKDYVQ